MINDWGSSNTGTADPATDAATSVSTERRVHPRRPFTVAAKILDPYSGTILDAHTTDLSLGGCYVDTMNAFTPGTTVELRLTKDGKSFHSMAKVVCSQASVGMGLAFSTVEKDQFTLLEQWLAELNGKRVHLSHLQEPRENARYGLGEKDEVRLALEDLLVELIRKGVLDQKEGEPILRRLLY